ncbi:MAG: phosphotransferase [Bacteroidales bacterium]|nr:phosphotransferase [Candidatus Cacconaster merdequi]
MDGNITRINLDEWVESGGGALGVTYFHKSDPSMIVKFNNATNTLEDIQREISISRKVFEMGIPSPEPSEMVTDGKRYGMMFKRIYNKISYARMIGSYPEKIDQTAAEMAALAKQLHSTRCDTSTIPNVKVLYRNLILRNNLHDEQIKQGALNLIDSIPDRDTCLHGDFHFGNVIKADGKSYFIDLGNFCYGDPYFDLAMLAEITVLASLDSKYTCSLYHCTPEQIVTFWKCFVKHYMGTDDPEGAKRLILPYIAIRQLGMEVESGKVIPDSATTETFALLREWSSK